MLNFEQGLFPSVAQFVRTDLPRALDRETVRNAFLHYSGLSESRARTVVALNNSRPRLAVTNLSLGPLGLPENGRFERSNPHRILLSQELATYHEGNAAEAHTRLLLEATLLHELVHWGYCATGHPEETDERGILFEEAAYGRVVRRGWEMVVAQPRFVFPVTGSTGAASSCWGPTVRSGGRAHHGIDVFGPIGTPVHAAADGRVLAGNRYRTGAAGRRETGNYGQMIDVKHADGLVTRYAHLDAVEVDPGRVRQGDRIGTLGATGTMYGAWHYGGRRGPEPPADAVRPHLHFEVRQHSGAAFGDFTATLDPASFFGWMGMGTAARNTPTQALAQGLPAEDVAA